MSIDLTTIGALVSAGASLAAGAYMGSAAARRVLRGKRYTPDNALELLTKERPEEWNEVRSLHPSWIPRLHGLKLANLSLPGINLANSEIESVDFSGADLSDANFSRARIRSARFVSTNLQGAIFNDASLEEIDLAAASLTATSFHRAQLSADQRDIVAKSASHGALEVSAHDILRDPEALNRMTERQLESLVARLLESDGYTVRADPSELHGYDFLIERLGPAGEKFVDVVEVKHYHGNRPLGFSTIRGLYAAKLANGADQAILVTTSPLSPTAWRAAVETSDVRIVDRNGLLAWLHRAGIAPTGALSATAK